ncbi:MAG: type II toxin-antitoxin system HicA family toxin [Thermodesulfobacteriota bacterium]
MPQFGPVSRKDLIRYLRHCGFEGPYSGGRHQFMIKGNITISVANPHQRDIGKELPARILRQAEITKAEWKKF